MFWMLLNFNICLKHNYYFYNDLIIFDESFYGTYKLRLVWKIKQSDIRSAKGKINERMTINKIETEMSLSVIDETTLSTFNSQRLKLNKGPKRIISEIIASWASQRTNWSVWRGWREWSPQNIIPLIIRSKQWQASSEDYLSIREVNKGIKLKLKLAKQSLSGIVALVPNRAALPSQQCRPTMEHMFGRSSRSRFLLA